MPSTVPSVRRLTIDGAATVRSLHESNKYLFYLFVLRQVSIQLTMAQFVLLRVPLNRVHLKFGLQRCHDS